MFVLTVTFVTFLSSMNSLMNWKDWISTKGLSTYITFTWFLSSVNSPMNYKAWISTKGLSTHIAFIWFLSSMNSLMNYKPCIYTKGLATYITFLWFLSSMNSPMNSKVWLSSIAMAIYFAYGFSPVWTHQWCWRCVYCLKQWPHTLRLYGFVSTMLSLMNYKGRFIIKSLTTYVTFICFSSCMDSLMSSEFWVLKKSYVALITTVWFFLVCFLL